MEVKNNMLLKLMRRYTAKQWGKSKVKIKKQTAKARKTLTPGVLNNMLFLGCKKGSPTLVRLALHLGADVNAQKKVSTYFGTYERNVYVSPLIYTAIYAKSKQDQRPYREVLQFLARAKPDTNCVASFKYVDELVDRELHQCSLTKVLQTRPTNMQAVSYFGDSIWNSIGSQFSISSSMSLYLGALFQVAANTKEPDPLAKKAAFFRVVTRNVCRDMSFDGKSAAEVKALRDTLEKRRYRANKALVAVRSDNKHLNHLLETLMTLYAQHQR